MYVSGFLQSVLSCVAALLGIKPLSSHILLMECTKAQIILPIAFTTRLDGGREKKCIPFVAFNWMCVVVWQHLNVMSGNFVSL